MTTTVFDLEAVGAVAVPLFSWPPSGSTPAPSAVDVPGAELVPLVSFHRPAPSVLDLFPVDDAERAQWITEDSAPAMARSPRPRCSARAEDLAGSPLRGRCRNRTWCGADLCTRHGGPTKPLPGRAADPTRLPKRVRYAAGLVEDLEFMRATGESWLGAWRRSGSPCASPRTATSAACSSR